MTVLCVLKSAARRPLQWLLASLLLTCFISQSRAGDVIAVMLDQARIFKLPDRATTIVIGDPMIADLAVQPGGLAVITGKALGGTNVIVMDKSGAVLMEKGIEVQGPSDPIVVVYKGVLRETYSCTPLCTPRITLGDDQDYFTKFLNESITRNNQAMAAGSGGQR